MHMFYIHTCIHTYTHVYPENSGTSHQGKQNLTVNMEQRQKPEASHLSWRTSYSEDK